MVASTMSKGTKVSIKFTPQAKDDYLYFDEDSGFNDTDTAALLANDLASGATQVWGIFAQDETYVQQNISSLVSNIAPNPSANLYVGADGNDADLLGDIHVEYEGSSGEITIAFDPAAYQHLAQGQSIETGSFTYVIRMANGAFSTAVGHIVIEGSNDAPIAVADTNSGAEDTTITGTVAANDSDPDDGAILTYVLNSPVAGLTLNSDGSYVFDASDPTYPSLAPGDTVDVVANYTVTDEHGASSSSTLTITLTGAGDGGPPLDIVAAGFAFLPNLALGVALQNGDGSFQPPTLYDNGTTYSGAYQETDALALVDLDGDGWLDIITGGYSDNNGSIAVLLGNSDGTFNPAMIFSSGTNYVSNAFGNYIETTVAIATGDVNEDGTIDVVSGGYQDNYLSPGTPLIGSMSVLLGNGDGTLDPGTAFTNGNTLTVTLPSYQFEQTHDVQLADLNNDGHLDIIAATSVIPEFSDAAGSVLTMLGNGDGTFEASSFYSTGSTRLDGFEFSQAIAVGDVNGDGNIDVVSGGHYDSLDPGMPITSIGVLLGNGDGTLGPATALSNGNTATFGSVKLQDTLDVELADLNADGYLDIIGGTAADIVYHEALGSVLTMLGNGDGTFQTAQHWSNGVILDSLSTEVTNDVAVADINGDGYLDIAAATSSGSVGLLYGNGDGSFETAVVVPMGIDSAYEIALGDWFLI